MAELKLYGNPSLRAGYQIPRYRYAGGEGRGLLSCCFSLLSSTPVEVCQHKQDKKNRKNNRNDVATCKRELCTFQLASKTP